MIVLYINAFPCSVQLRINFMGRPRSLNNYSRARSMRQFTSRMCLRLPSAKVPKNGCEVCVTTDVRRFLLLWKQISPTAYQFALIISSESIFLYFYNNFFVFSRFPMTTMLIGLPHNFYPCFFFFGCGAVVTLLNKDPLQKHVPSIH